LFSGRFQSAITDPKIPARHAEIATRTGETAAPVEDGQAQKKRRMIIRNGRSSMGVPSGL